MLACWCQPGSVAALESMGLVELLDLPLALCCFLVLLPLLVLRGGSLDLFCVFLVLGVWGDYVRGVVSLVRRMRRRRSLSLALCFRWRRRSWLRLLRCLRCFASCGLVVVLVPAVGRLMLVPFRIGVDFGCWVIRFVYVV